MIRELEIEGFKSIERLKLQLGRVTVLIGENGCGKSNILEAIAFVSAAYEDRLDHEFLASRGIRSPEPRLMRPAFKEAGSGSMRVSVTAAGHPPVAWLFEEEGTSVSRTAWSAHPDVIGNEVTESEGSPLQSPRYVLRRGDYLSLSEDQDIQDIEALLRLLARNRVLETHEEEVRGFLVFSPENSALRVFQREGQILPIGINGEGLFAHLRALDEARAVDVLEELNRRLALIDWFDGFEVPSDLGLNERRLTIRDRYLTSELSLDQRSANEGFLFLLFYYTLLLSPETPKFFAIDNIDASLNPRLCARLMRDVTELAKGQDRQVVVTTHNPAVLDGLDLDDEDQRLLVVSRTMTGATRVRRVRAPEPIDGMPTLRLSEAFIQGMLGGLPGNF